MCDNSPAYGMVGAAYRAGHHANRSLRVCRHVFRVCKEGRRKHGRHARVLHAHLDSDGALLGRIELENPPDGIAQHVAEPVVEEHHRKHKEQQREPVREQVRTHRHDDAAHNQCKANHAYRGHIRTYFLEHRVLAQEIVANKANQNRRNRHIQDIQEHPLRVHVNARIGKPQHQQRSHEGRKQGRNHRHAHRVGHVTLGQEAHHVARDATRAAAHENDAHGKVGVQPKNLGEREGHQGHDGVLRAGTQQNVERLLHEVFHVIDSDGEAHAEHDDAQDDGTRVAMHPAEKDGSEERYNSATDDNQGCVGRKETAKGPNDLEHAQNIALSRVRGTPFYKIDLTGDNYRANPCCFPIFFVLTVF